MLYFCGLALCALAAILTLRGQRSEFAQITAFAAAAILFGSAVVKLLPTVAIIREELESSGFSGYIEPLFKALGITLIVQFCAELCRDAGESALASKLELIGRAEILLLTLPLLRELSELARGLVG